MATPDSRSRWYNIMLSHGIIHASHLADMLSSIDGVIDAIDVKEIWSKKLSSFLSSM
jgi:hypothetical protein